MELEALRAGQVQGDAAGSRSLDRGSVHLDLADADGPVARHDAEGSSGTDGSPAQGPGHDRATTLDRERAVDRQP